MDCQLDELPTMGETLPWTDRLRISVSKRATRAATVVWSLARRIGHRPAPPGTSAPTESLGLVRGERVRIRPSATIRATLDADGRFHGLAYVESRDRFAGRTARVKKRVNTFFDERTRRLLKVRDVVILEDVYCEPSVGAPVDYAGCGRTCFLFWKEAWLERVDSH